MLLDEIDMVSPFYRLELLNKKIKGIHKLSLNFNAVKENELIETFNMCERIKTNVIKTTPFNNYMSNKDYTCACLIQEAISLYLTEILPVRRTKIKKSGVNK